MRKFFVLAVVAFTAIAVIGIRTISDTGVSIKRHYVNDKLFSEGEYLRNFIMFTNKDVISFAEKFRGNSEQATIINTYNAIEKNYHYIEDGNTTWSDGTITIHDTGDYWQTPILSLAIIKETGGFYGDCEDGSILLESLLRADGITDTWLTIGTVTLSSGIYGHAWVTWKHNGQSFLLETVRGKPLSAIIPVPTMYDPYIMTNGTEVRVFTGASVNFPMLTREARQELISEVP